METNSNASHQTQTGKQSWIYLETRRVAGRGFILHDMILVGRRAHVGASTVIRAAIASQSILDLSKEACLLDWNTSGLGSSLLLHDGRILRVRHRHVNGLDCNPRRFGHASSWWNTWSRLRRIITRRSRWLTGLLVGLLLRRLRLIVVLAVETSVVLWLLLLHRRLGWLRR